MTAVLIALIFALAFAGILAARRRAAPLPMPLQPNPALQAYQLRPGVVYAAETAEEAVRIANDELFDEVDLADARQLADHELDARVFLRDSPDDDDPYTTLRHELAFRRRIGRAGALCGNDPD